MSEVSVSQVSILITAISTALVLVMAAVVQMIVTLRNSKKTDVAVARTADLQDTVNSVAEKTIEIHTATNGTLHTMLKTLEVANEKISGLEKLIAEMVTEREPAKEPRKPHKKD